jgi:hypothetical protein
MSEENTTAQTQEKPSDKELNFRALESKYKTEMQREKEKFDSLQRELSEIKNYMQKKEEPEDDDPYIDHKKFDKKIGEYDKKMQANTQTQIQTAIQKAISEDRRERWLDTNKDFYDVLKHADKLYEEDQELAETILQMPDTFERQKLVYKNIKALGLHKEKKPVDSTQDRINARMTGAHYQPSSQNAAPYGSAGDFSPGGQKNAYDQMKQLQKRMRL